MSFTTYLRAHRVADISFRRRFVRCTCGERMAVKGPPSCDDTNAAIEAAWLAHRRVEGQRLRTVANALLTRTA